ncbi:SAM-dependent methyltransferase [Bailinhaonella thermotolerans]|uniref:SAM-dependent methyltransferase n=1 Tax=Bailinhaonella thermotolerans TaxID=1070861 RepID=UPI00192A28B3|nr:SAM-dependent methyltransferase [Bailinhaonella thermotolerans]
MNTTSCSSSVAHSDHWLGLQHTAPDPAAEIRYEHAHRAVTDVLPTASAIAAHVRRMILRAVQHAAEAGILQYLIVTPGNLVFSRDTPSGESIYQLAASFLGADHEHVRVLTISSDPAYPAIGHVRSSTKGVLTAGGRDVTDAAAVLPAARAEFKPSLPTCVILPNTMQYMGDEQDPAAYVATLMAPMPPKSRLVLTHGTSDSASRGIVGSLTGIYADAGLPMHFRTALDVANIAMAGGLTLMTPGVVSVQQWHASQYDHRRTPVTVLGCVAEQPT